MWEQIQANRRRSIVLITAMLVVLILLGYAGGELLAGPGAGLFGIFVALVIWGIQMIIYATSAESILLQGTCAREIHKEDSPQLFNVVEEMSLAAGLGFVPRIHLIDDPSPNAFAMGRKPETSVIAVTTGLLHRLNRDELQGVIAHEIGHLKNRDVQFMTLAAVLLGSIAILSELIWRSMRFGGRSRSRSSERGGGQAQLIILILALLLVILGPILAQLLYFACSRKREFLADASSAQFTRYPEGLASALEKISRATVPVSFANKATAPMFIVNPLAADGGSVGLLSTHPSTTERVRILRSMTGASLSDYNAAFQRLTGNSVISSQTLQESTATTIREPSDDGPIESRRDAKSISHRADGYVRVHCNCGLEISVPAGYEQESIRCIRCGSDIPIPSAAVPPVTESATPPVLPALQYIRTGTGWESFRCTCGRTLQLSPSFAAPHIRCTGCGQLIEVQ